MDNHAVKLLLVRLVEEFCIAAHGVKRDDKVAIYLIALIIIECYDVRVVVML